VGQDLTQPNLLQPARLLDADLAALACDFDVFLEGTLHRCALGFPSRMPSGSIEIRQY
jgi:hypothetical protein